MSDEFDKIVDNIDLDDLIDPRDPKTLTTWEIHRAVLAFNEAAAYLSEYLMAYLMDKTLVLPEEVTGIIRQIFGMAHEITTTLTQDYSEETCPNCTDVLICDQCLDYLEDLDG